MTALPQSFKQEIDELRGEFGDVEVERVSRELVLIQLRVRGVSVRAVVDLDAYPDRPPLISTEGSWRHSNLLDDGSIRGLACLDEWNRTYGLGVAVRELNRRFIEEPPDR